MAKFTTPSLVSETIWNMRLADLPRGTNRGLINSLVNGNPPYTKQEAEENNIEINVNFLDATQLCADARRSLYNAFQAPGKFFTVTQDFGPAFRRQQWGREITNSINRRALRCFFTCIVRKRTGLLGFMVPGLSTLSGFLALASMSRFRRSSSWAS